MSGVESTGACCCCCSALLCCDWDSISGIFSPLFFLFFSFLSFPFLGLFAPPSLTECSLDPWHPCEKLAGRCVWYCQLEDANDTSDIIQILARRCARCSQSHAEAHSSSSSSSSHHRRRLSYRSSVVNAHDSRCNTSRYQQHYICNCSASSIYAGLDPSTRQPPSHSYLHTQCPTPSTPRSRGSQSCSLRLPELIAPALQFTAQLIPRIHICTFSSPHPITFRTSARLQRRHRTQSLHQPAPHGNLSAACP